MSTNKTPHLNLHSWIGTDNVKRDEMNKNFDDIDKIASLTSADGEVRAATTANITLSGAQTIDGVAVVVNDRVLVKNQTTASQNGIYDVQSGTWSRSVDADTSAKMKKGVQVYVKEGTANGKKEWRLVTTGAITFGTTSLSFELANDPIDLAPAIATTLTLNVGTNIYNVPRKTRFKSLQMAGRTLVNLLGRNGNCDSNSIVGGPFQITTSLDATTFVSGVGSIKMTLNASMTTGSAQFNNKVNVVSGKYYVAIAMMRVGTASNTSFFFNGYSSQKNSSPVTDSTKFQPYWRAYAAASNASPAFEFQLSGTAGQTAYIDEARVYEISLAEYNALDALTPAQIAAKYPYVDDMKHVNAVYAINSGDNIFPQFPDLERIDAPWVMVSPTKLTATTTAVGQLIGTNFLPATNGIAYTLSFGAGTTTNFSVIFRYVDKYGNFLYDTGWVAYTGAPMVMAVSPAGTVGISLAIGNVVATIAINEPILNPGGNAATYKPQSKSYLFLPDVQARSNFDVSIADQVYMLDDQVRIVRRFKEITLDGSLTWGFGSEGAGFKMVATTINGGVTNSERVVKYDGKILTNSNGSYTAADQSTLFSPANSLSITIADTDSGWGESYSPSPAEIAANANGWRMFSISGGSRIPYDGVSGDAVKHFENKANAGDTANGLTTAPTYPAPGFTPNRVMYQLAQSLDEPVNSEGQLEFFNGNNQLEFGTGIVVRESKTPAESSGQFFFNHTGLEGGKGRLNNRSNRVFSVYRSGDKDAVKIYTNYGMSGSSYGGLGLELPGVFEYSKVLSSAYSISYFALDTYMLGIAPTNILGDYAPNMRETNDDQASQVTDIRRDLNALQLETMPRQGKRRMQFGTLLPSVGPAFAAYDDKDKLAPLYVKQVSATSPTVNAKAAFMMYDDATDEGRVAAIHDSVTFKPLVAIGDGLYYRSALGTPDPVRQYVWNDSVESKNKRSFVHAVSNVVNQPVSMGTDTKVGFNGEYSDFKNEFNTSTNTFTATQDGVYVIATGVDLNGCSAGDDLILYLYANGSKARTLARNKPGASGNLTITGNNVIHLSAGATVDIRVYNGTRAVTINSDPLFTYLIIIRVA